MNQDRHPAAETALKAYKSFLSPVFYALGAQCRHEPTCSEYAADAVSRHGIWQGGWMTMARLCRCRPGGSWGYDPAPEKCPEAPIFMPWRYGDWSMKSHTTTTRTGSVSADA